MAGEQKGNPPECPGCRARDRRIRQLEKSVETLRETVHQLVRDLEELRRENQELRAENRRLKARGRELEARLEQNSRNSSRPPSSDQPEARGQRSRKPPTGRKRGGQPGHEGKSRPWIPESQVDPLEKLHPEGCGGCGRKFSRREKAKSQKFRRHQGTEIPEPKPETWEWQLCAL